MHGMTWKQEMHVIFDTTWHLLAAGETSTWISCSSTCLFLGEERNKSRSADFFLLSKDGRKRHSLPVFFWSIKKTVLNIQRIVTCLLLIWKNGINLKCRPSSVSFFERLRYIFFFFVSKTLICIPLYKRAVRFKVNATHFSLSSQKKGDLFLIDRLLSIALAALTDEDYK